MFCQYCENELGKYLNIYEDEDGEMYMECPTCGKCYYVDLEENEDGNLAITQIKSPVLEFEIEIDEDGEYTENDPDDYEISHYPTQIKYWYYIISTARPNGFKSKFDGVVKSNNNTFPLKDALGQFKNEKSIHIIESVNEISKEDYEWFYSETSKFKGLK